MISIETYALAKKYVEETADALGAVKGASCRIDSVTKVDGVNTIRFKWIGDSGVVKYTTMEVADGAEGLSIKSVDINNNNELIITYSDDTIKNCGKIESKAELSEPLTATVEIGTVTSGKTYAKGTSLEQIIRDMLIKYNPPAITLSATPSTKLYDIVTDTVATILLKANVTKKTEPVTKVSFYADSALINEVTAGVASGGNFQYQYTPDVPINTDITFKATATDGEQTSTSTFTIKFVAKSYYGICDADVSDPDETAIKSGTSILKDTKNLTYSNITTDWGKVFYAYPKSFGTLTYIKDEVNNINYFDSFQRSEKTVDGIVYYCYTLIDPTAAENNQIVFK